MDVIATRFRRLLYGSISAQSSMNRLGALVKFSARAKTAVTAISGAP